MSSKPVVLVTGVTGYIAGWIVKYYLDAGYKVRGTTRSKKSAEPLISVLSSYASDIEIYEIADITVPGAFDEAVKGVEVIAHLASPVSFGFTDPDPVIHTAVQGAVGILQSAKKYGDKVKTFIQMSSIVAIVDFIKPAPYIYNETDWNDFAYETAKKAGKQTPGVFIYMASKAESERAVWKFRDEEKPAFNIIAINPAWVSGPPVVPPTDASKISETILTIWNIFSGKEAWGELGPNPSYVHVYDVARLFVWAAENGDKANGERYLAVAGRGSEQAIADILREAYPGRRDVIKEGTPKSGYKADYTYDPEVFAVSTSKAVEATGQDWIKYDRVVLETAKAFEPLVTV